VRRFYGFQNLKQSNCYLELSETNDKKWPIYHIHSSRRHFYSRQKKTWPVREKNQFLSHKSYSNVTIILCISIIMIFNCFPMILWYFRQVHGHRFFFSLLTAFAIHTRRFTRADVSLQRPNLCSKWTLTSSVDSWGPLETFLFKLINCYPYFAPLKMF
jgi:hypothetical protein